MRRLFQVLSALFLIFIFIIMACTAATFILTGGDPLTTIRTTLVQYTLSLRSDELNKPAGNSDQVVRFEVAPGTTTGQIANNLQESGLITDVDLFIDFTVANGIDSQLEAGTYFLSNNKTIPEIAYLLTDSNSSQLPFRILEGWRLEEIAAAIERNHLFGFGGDDFLAVVQTGSPIPSDFAAYAGVPEGASLEGFLYPDTYLLPPNITPTGLRDTLLNTFRERVTEQMIRDAQTQGFTLYEVVTLASISEREAVHSEEHPLILSVYRNRLAIGMKLDADPTVQYALNNTRGSWWASITRNDYTGVNSPYNTYLYNGLPPGPIANPNLSSITAAIYPQETAYMYFRAACDDSGYHEFAVTYEEHLSNGCTG